MLTTSLPINVDNRSIPDRLTALADPTRLAILALLRRQDHCVCHLVDALELKQSIVSHHVGVLRRAGLVTSWQHPADRRWLYYRLDRPALRQMIDHLGWLLDEDAYTDEPLPCAADEPRGVAS